MLTLATLPAVCCLLPLTILYMRRSHKHKPIGDVGLSNGHKSDSEQFCLLIGNRLAECGRHNLSSPLESRAIPNQRLKSPFVIETTFTSTDASVTYNFIREARK